MDGEPVYVSGLPVASPLVNIPAHVEMDGIAADLVLLAHVLQLHVWQMDWREVSKDLMRETARKNRMEGFIITSLKRFCYTDLALRKKKKSNKNI